MLFDLLGRQYLHQSGTPSPVIVIIVIVVLVFACPYIQPSFVDNDLGANLVSHIQHGTDRSHISIHAVDA
jgi:hypothetical protein